jgi:hypothetical protein
MIQIALGSILLSLIHALIPNHWIPLVAIGRTEKWSRSETLVATGIAGFAHTASTVIIGIIVGSVGYELSGRYSSLVTIVGPSILVLLGTVYLVLGAGHSHDDFSSRIQKTGGRRKSPIILTLAFSMFFSPCIEIEAYYFSAGMYGWAGIIVVSTIYLSVTVMGMLLLVNFGLKGAKKIRSHFLEHHEKKLTGAILIVLGIAAYFLDF